MNRCKQKYTQVKWSWCLILCALCWPLGRKRPTMYSGFWLDILDGSDCYMIQTLRYSKQGLIQILINLLPWIWNSLGEVILEISVQMDPVSAVGRPIGLSVGLERLWWFHFKPGDKTISLSLVLTLSVFQRLGACFILSVDRNLMVFSTMQSIWANCCCWVRSLVASTCQPAELLCMPGPNMTIARSCGTCIHLQHLMCWETHGAERLLGLCFGEPSDQT